MYKYHYGFMKENVDVFELLYGDTDSCIDNKKLPGKMRDEDAGKIIYENEFLKSKMYSLKTVEGGKKSYHKGHNSFIRYGKYEHT